MYLLLFNDSVYSNNFLQKSNLLLLNERILPHKIIRFINNRTRYIRNANNQNIHTRHLYTIKYTIYTQSSLVAVNVQDHAKQSQIRRFASPWSGLISPPRSLPSV